MASKLCDACKSATATLFCRADTAFLCLTCDSKVHAANKLASRHPRVWVCEVCESAPAHVTCKADAAALCVSCDRDIHSANPLARRHLRLPVSPFFNSPSSDPAPAPSDHRFFSDGDIGTEEAEASTWLLPNPSNHHTTFTHSSSSNNKAMMMMMEDNDDPDLNTVQYVLPETDPYLDLDYYCNIDPKQEAQEQNSSGTDGVVPVQSNKSTAYAPPSTTTPPPPPPPPAAAAAPALVNDSCYDLDFTTGSKSFPTTYTGYSLSHSVSSSSLDVGVVPDGSAMADITNPYGRSSTGPDQTAVQLSGVDREARVLRYREKRKNRKFEKTIRYASRKAYAETRPRIKGRFAKRTDLDAGVIDSAGSLFGFGVVPSF